MLETAMEEKPKLDRAAVRKLKLGEEDESLEYWLTQTPAARLRALENLRNPHDYPAPRLQRAFTIVKREEG